MAESYSSYPPATPGEPKKRNTTLIIIIILVILCCCCAGLAGLANYAWNNGDMWLEQLRDAGIITQSLLAGLI